MATVPIFIPHQGCRNDCVFCNQKSITGQNTPPSFEETRKIIGEHLKTLHEKPQIAFFGGSFTGIGEEAMEGYLKIAHEYVVNGNAEGVRISTRPDYIDEKILSLLKKYSVTHIELGAQSMDDEVLKKANRGHSSECVCKASEMILKEGFTLGLQMMIGLPLDTYEKSLETARKFVALGAKETRIYPTVIIENTRLLEMYENGEYTPMTFDEAVTASADCLKLFLENNIRVLRIGLPSSEGLKKSVRGGFYHEAIGEMVYSRLVRNAVMREKNPVEVRYSKKFLSKVLGQRRENVEYLKKMGADFSLTEDNSFDGVKVNGKMVLTI